MINRQWLTDAYCFGTVNSWIRGQRLPVPQIYYKEFILKYFAFTIDLEADLAGVVNRYDIFNKLDKVEEVLTALNSAGIKITVFVVCELLHLFPDVIKLFEKYNCEFEPHSYSHNFHSPDSDSEIEKSKEAYINYFRTDPKGYRAPRGKISDAGIKSLQKKGFLYDSSIFPSYFPNPFRYLFCSRDVHYYKGSNIMEIPFTSLSPLRLTLSVSYIKLLGVDFFKKLSLPGVVCFGSHLHDFIFIRESFDRLPLIWRLIYSRNRYRGLELCMNYLEYVKKKGYQFCYMSEIYDSHKR